MVLMLLFQVIIPYIDLPTTSILWSVGALLAQEKPALWNEYVDYLIYQRQCALDGMTEHFYNTEKYKNYKVKSMN